jgi:hypothetical protein
VAVTRSDPVAESPSHPRPEWQQLGFAPWVEPTYRWFRPVLPLLGIYAMVRVGLAVADALAAHLTYGTHPDGPLTAWDGNWYLAVAAHGYPAVAPTAAGHLTYGAAGFEPVFPALIRVMEAAGFTSIQAAVAVSIVAGAVSVVLVWRLATVIFDEQVGSIAAILFIVFPGMAIAWGMTYSESVGLALAAGCLLLMVKERWFWAGVSGALATGTSPMALPLAVAALVAVIQALRRRRGAPGALIALALIPTGFIAYVVVLGVRYHDMLYWWHLQHEAWGARVDFGKSLLVLLVHPWTGGYQGKGWMEWVGVIVVIAAVAILVRSKLPAPLIFYCLATFALMFVSNSLGFKPRFLTWAFPALIALAAVSRRRGWQPIAMAFAFLMPLVFIAYASFGDYMIQP